MRIKQKFKNKELTKTKVVKNLLRYYALATPEDIQTGINWYPEANQFCKDLSDRYDLDLCKVVGITAALSPQTSWDMNKRYASDFIENRGRGFMGNRERTIKAKNIYNANDPAKIQDYLATTPNGAKKTKAFYRNILLPGFCDTVCIDRHALAAGQQRPENTKALQDSEAHLSGKQYSFLSDCYVYAANKVGMIPSSFQAVIWTVYRKQRGLDKTVNTANENGFVPMDIENF